MKLIKNIISILIISIAALVIYMNYDNIKMFINQYIFKDEVITYESNEYKRNYTYNFFKISEDYTPSNKDDLLNIYYNVLNNGWNKFTFYCPYEYTNCLEDIETISTDETKLSNINGYTSPYNSFKSLDTTITSFGEITITAIKNYSSEEIDMLKAKVQELVVSLNLMNLSDREKITKIHNHIITTTKYDLERADKKTSQYASDKATGVLVEGYAVCSGYSDALALFLDYFNIPNIKVASEEHVWNLVFIEDKWMHVDLTWDDNDNSPIPRKNFLLIDTNKLLELDVEQHTFDKTFFLEAN